MDVDAWKFLLFARRRDDLGEIVHGLDFEQLSVGPTRSVARSATRTEQQDLPSQQDDQVNMLDACGDGSPAGVPGRFFGDFDKERKTAQRSP